MAKTTARVIRKELQETAETSKKDEVLSIVDDYVRIYEQYKAEEARFKKRTKHLKNRLDSLSAELKKLAKDKNVTILEGDDGVIEFKPKVNRRIDPEKFFAFLKKKRQAKDGWRFFSVGLSKAIKAFGEEPLLNDDVLEVKVDKFARIEIVY